MVRSCVMDLYVEPKQVRAQQTEFAFLTALDVVLQRKSFEAATVEEIAREAGLTKSAFLKRFGTKRMALYVLFERYCEKASAQMADIVQALPSYASLVIALKDMSQCLSRLLANDLAANRAMQEDFLMNLEAHALTKKIHRECVEMMRRTQAQFLIEQPYSDVGASAAAQMLITINFNYALKAMPSLPANPDDRHQMIAEILELVIRK